MSSSREWSRGGDEQLPPRVEDLSRHLMTETILMVQDQVKAIVGHGDIDVAVNLALSFQRFPGDDKPFLAIVSFPDDERIAYAFIRRIYNIMEGRGLGKE